MTAIRSRTLGETPVMDEPDRASYSSLTLHRKCPQAWHYRYLRGLEKVEETEPAVERDFGTWWHAVRAAHAIDRGRQLGSLLEEPKKLNLPDPMDPMKIEDVEGNLVKEVYRLAVQFWERMPHEFTDQFISRMGEPLPQRLLNLDKSWRKEHAEALKRERPLLVEFKWVREVQGRTMVGYVDEIYEDSARGIVVARDHKTSKKLDIKSTVEDMMDSQLHFYTWGVAPRLTELGIRVSAVAYDRVRSIKSQNPQITQSGTLSKSVTDYSLDAYLEWAKGPDGEGVPYPGRKKDGSGAGVYFAEQSVIEKLASPSSRSAWFQRTLTPLNRNIIETHVRAGLRTIEDTTRTTKAVEEEGQAGRNLGPNCKWCDFAPLCRAEMVGGVDGEYLLSDYNLRGPFIG